MRGIAKKLGVPTIEIINKVRIEDSDAKIDYVYLQDESADRPVRSVLINRNGYRYMFEGNWDDGSLKDVFRGNKNFYGGHNPITKDEYLTIRPFIAAKLTTPAELSFLRQIDQKFELNMHTE